jgi:6-phosphogluconolactonase
VITPTGGRIGSAAYVNITCGTAGSNVVYTVDGSLPTHSGATITNGFSFQLMGPFKVPYGAPTVRAIGFKTGYSDSAEAVEIFSNPVYVYAANQFPGSISAFRLDTVTGALALAGTYTAPAPLCVTVDPLGKFLFVGGSNSGGSIRVFPIDPSTGGLLTPILYPVGVTPASLRFHPTKNVLYAANSNGTAASFDVDPGTGALTNGLVYAAGSGPGSLAIDPLGRFLYDVDTGSSFVSAFAISATGLLTETVPPSFSMGTNVVAAAVEGSGQYLYAVDLAAAICLNSINPGTGVLTLLSTTPTTMGISPRVVAIDPSGTYLYCVDSSLSQVEGYMIDSGGGLTFINTVTTGGGPQGIAIDPSGRYLFLPATAATTGVMVLAIDPGTGQIAYLNSFADPGQIATYGIVATGIAQ